MALGAKMVSSVSWEKANLKAGITFTTTSETIILPLTLFLHKLHI